MGSPRTRTGQLESLSVYAKRGEIRKMVDAGGGLFFQCYPGAQNYWPMLSAVSPEIEVRRDFRPQGGFLTLRQIARLFRWNGLSEVFMIFSSARCSWPRTHSSAGILE